MHLQIYELICVTFVSLVLSLSLGFGFTFGHEAARALSYKLFRYTWDDERFDPNE